MIIFLIFKMNKSRKKTLFNKYKKPIGAIIISLIDFIIVDGPQILNITNNSTSQNFNIFAILTKKTYGIVLLTIIALVYILLSIYSYRQELLDQYDQYDRHKLLKSKLDQYDRHKLLKSKLDEKNKLDIKRYIYIYGIIITFASSKIALLMISIALIGDNINKKLYYIILFFIISIDYLFESLITIDFQKLYQKLYPECILLPINNKDNNKLTSSRKRYVVLSLVKRMFLYIILPLFIEHIICFVVSYDDIKVITNNRKEIYLPLYITIIILLIAVMLFFNLLSCYIGYNNLNASNKTDVTKDEQARRYKINTISITLIRLIAMPLLYLVLPIILDDNLNVFKNNKIKNIVAIIITIIAFAAEMIDAWVSANHSQEKKLYYDIYKDSFTTTTPAIPVVGASNKVGGGFT